MAESNQPKSVNYYVSFVIKDIKYNPINIRYICIREWIFNILPTIEIEFTDIGSMIEQYPLEDSEDINITIGKSEDDPKPIKMTFSLDDYDFGILGDNRTSVVNLTGHLKANSIYLLKNKSFPKSNSAAVLSQVASGLELTFSNPHNIVPSDNMTWIQSNQNDFDFIRHVAKRAFVPDDSIFCYADIYNRLVYTSLNKELGKQKAKMCKFDPVNYGKSVKDDKDIDDTIWFASYSIVNRSGYFNKRSCYGSSYNYYDLTDGISETYSKIKKANDLSFRNNKYVGSSVAQITYRDYNGSNLYGTEYYESLVRNKMLKENFFANSVVVNINSLSDVRLMDKISLTVPSLLAKDESNEVRSGYYLVAGVQHEISKGGIYRKQIALGNNSINKSAKVVSYVTGD